MALVNSVLVTESTSTILIAENSPRLLTPCFGGMKNPRSTTDVYSVSLYRVEEANLRRFPAWYQAFQGG